MAKILEFREKIKAFCGKHETYVKMALRFILAFISFLLIYYHIGYFEKLHSIPILIGLAIVCALLPVNVTILVSAILVLVNLYALSMEVCAVAAVMFLIMLFLYFRFAPKEGYHVLLTPMMFTVGIPYVMPVSAGLLRTPSSLISVVCGTVIFYFLKGVKSCEGVLSDSTQNGSVSSSFSLVLNQIFNNKEMILVVVVFLVTSILVYFIRRMSIDHAWTKAIGIGTMFNVIVLLIGYVMLHTPDRIVSLIIGELICLVISFVIKFYSFNLDYSRVERVQFEDDEYYYYVKAVPKQFVATANKMVKNFTDPDAETQIEAGTRKLFEEEHANTLEEHEKL